MTSIEESLLKIADKVDPDNKVEVSPNNLNPNYSIQRSLERIADSDLGGGGLTYVIPAQDATFVTELGSVKAFVSNVNIEGLNNGASVAARIIVNGQPMFQTGTYSQSAKKFEFSEIGDIQYLNSSWIWQMPDVPAGTVINLAVVKNF